MTKNEIMNMARMSGLIFIDEPDESHQHQLEIFAKLVAKKEREACAKIVEEKANICDKDTLAWKLLSSNAHAIRARGQQ